MSAACFLSVTSSGFAKGGDPSPAVSRCCQLNIERWLHGVEPCSFGVPSSGADGGAWKRGAAWSKVAAFSGSGLLTSGAIWDTPAGQAHGLC